MPLPPPTCRRERLHARTLVLEGWKREDGLWDLEGRLTDIKDHDYVLATGLRKAGDALHDMRVRLTIDRAFNVIDVAVSHSAVPYPGAYEGSCGSILPAYSRLKGLNLAQGFRRAVGEMFKGTRGCSHLTELLLSLPTVAFQTFAGETNDTDDRNGKPFQLDHCHALETSTETVRRYYPRWFRGQKNG